VGQGGCGLSRGSGHRPEFRAARRTAVIEQATGRRVIGFMSGNQQDPEIMCEVFILAPTDLLDDDEIRAAEAGAPLA
jgi:hypothetical protein